MNHSLVILACTGFFLATSLHPSQAQGTFKPATPSGGSNEPDSAGRGTPGDHVPYIPYKKFMPEQIGFRPPTITGYRMEKGRVWFTFTSAGYNTARYNIRWSRPGKAQGDVRIYTGRGEEEYMINERPLWDTVYYFEVQALAKGSGYNLNGVSYPPPLTKFVGQAFRTPHDPKLGNRINTLSKPSPFSGINDARVPLIPNPSIGREGLNKVEKKGFPSR